MSLLSKTVMVSHWTVTNLRMFIYIKTGANYSFYRISLIRMTKMVHHTVECKFYVCIVIIYK